MIFCMVEIRLLLLVSDADILSLVRADACDSGVHPPRETSPRGWPQPGGGLETGGRHEGLAVAGAVQRLCSAPPNPFS